MTRRTKADIARDRVVILNYLEAKGGRFDERGIDHLVPARWVRTEEWMQPSDVAALVTAGKIEREVRREWEPQRGSRVNGLFGGAGVCQRRRAYIRSVCEHTFNNSEFTCDICGTDIKEIP